MTDLSVRDVLLGAADLIDENGLWQGAGRSRGRAHCAVTGIYATAHNSPIALSAARAFQSWLGLENASFAIYAWNDAEHRTAELVCKELRACADSLDDGAVA